MDHSLLAHPMPKEVAVNSMIYMEKLLFGFGEFEAYVACCNSNPGVVLAKPPESQAMLGIMVSCIMQLHVMRNTTP